MAFLSSCYFICSFVLKVVAKARAAPEITGLWWAPGAGCCDKPFRLDLFWNQGRWWEMILTKNVSDWAPWGKIVSLHKDLRCEHSTSGCPWKAHTLFLMVCWKSCFQMAVYGDIGTGLWSLLYLKCHSPPFVSLFLLILGASKKISVEGKLLTFEG